MAHSAGGTPGITAPGQNSGYRIGQRVLAAFGIAILLVALNALVVSAVNPARVLISKHYYMALGNSISFGYQPDLNFSSGYVDDVFSALQPSGTNDEVNLACSGETTTTMIAGNCLFHLVHHNAYTGAQLDAAVRFLKQHRAAVSPITLDIGANDVLSDWDETTCSPEPGATADLAVLDQNLAHTILPRLVNALGGGVGFSAADLVMLNYYNPFARECPNSLPFVHMLNQNLASDAALFRIPIIDVYTAFGGDARSADLVCTYTWICDRQFHDIHPTSLGYQVMASAVEHALGYAGFPGINSAPALPPFNGQPPGQADRRGAPMLPAGAIAGSQVW